MPKKKLLFNYYDEICQMQSQKLRAKMRIHQSMVVHATLSLKFGDSLKLSVHFEPFPSVFACLLACLLVRSFFAIKFSICLQSWRLCAYAFICWMSKIEICGWIFLSRLFFSHLTSTWLQSFQVTEIAFTCIWKWQMQTGVTLYVRFHCTMASVIYFQNCNKWRRCV